MRVSPEHAGSLWTAWELLRAGVGLPSLGSLVAASRAGIVGWTGGGGAAGWDLCGTPSRASFFVLVSANSAFFQSWLTSPRPSGPAPKPSTTRTTASVPVHERSFSGPANDGVPLIPLHSGRLTFFIVSSSHLLLLIPLHSDPFRYIPIDSDSLKSSIHRASAVNRRAELVRYAVAGAVVACRGLQRSALIVRAACSELRVAAR